MNTYLKLKTVAVTGLLAASMSIHAQTNDFWKNWNVQAGLDMTLQNPYGYDFSDVIPNGKSFGLDMAINKWVTPEIGFRGKINWENGLGLFRNNHANWLAPFYQPGVNRDKGGYVAAYADLPVNLHNLFGTYQSERFWNTAVYPRVGVAYNFGVSKGAILLGAGWLNTFRINDKWSVYADLSYNMIGSGFVGSQYVAGTGTGSNSNGYLDLNVGVQMAIGGSGFDSGHQKNLLDGWFVQTALDLSFMNPYGCKFADTFSKGRTHGLTVALGKEFTSQFAVRGRVQWENGLFKNSSLEWVPPVNNPAENYRKGGFAVIGLDAMFNMSNIVDLANEENRWHTSAFVRAALISQFAIHSGSPVLGVGVEETYKINDKLSVFADGAYQVTTSESSAGMTGMKVSKGTNGFFDLGLGVKIKL